MLYIFYEFCEYFLKNLYLRRLFEVDIYHEIYLVNGFLWYRFRTVVLGKIFLLDSDR